MATPEYRPMNLPRSLVVAMSATHPAPIAISGLPKIACITRSPRNPPNVVVGTVASPMHAATYPAMQQIITGRLPNESLSGATNDGATAWKMRYTVRLSVTYDTLCPNAPASVSSEGVTTTDEMGDASEAKAAQATMNHL